LEAVLPQFLVQRGWSVRFQSAGRGMFSLPARGDRKVVFTLVPGADFKPSDVGKDALIQIQTRIDGQLIGGMSYQVDPNLKHPPNENAGGEHADREGEHDEDRENDRDDEHDPDREHKRHGTHRDHH
jgi:hypothetical protein